jgi:hypothetical protein
MGCTDFGRRESFRGCLSAIDDYQPCWERGSLARVDLAGDIEVVKHIEVMIEQVQERTGCGGYRCPRNHVSTYDDCRATVWLQCLEGQGGLDMFPMGQVVTHYRSVLVGFKRWIQNHGVGTIGLDR